jgi:type II secretory pathway pseudopilin PulG
MELLVVFSIMAILMGMSIGAFARISQGSVLDSNEKMLRAALMRSRINARTKAALTAVTIIPPDLKTGASARLRTAWTVMAGSWHFEEQAGSKALGGRNRHADMRSVSRDENGSVGRCVTFNGGGSVTCDSYPDLDPREGFSLSLDLMPEPEIGGATIFSFGESFTLTMGEKGGLVGTVTLDAESKVVRLETGPWLLEAGAWTRVELSFDGIEVMLRAHNVVEARQKVKGPLRAPGPQGRFTIGSGNFKGKIDEVVYRTMIFEDDEELDPDIDIKLQSPVTVRFDVDGRLDPRVHSEDVVIPMEMEDERTTITVKTGGMIR